LTWTKEDAIEDGCLENIQTFHDLPPMGKLRCLLGIVVEEMPKYKALSVGSHPLLRTSSDNTCWPGKLLVLLLCDTGVPWTRRRWAI